MKTNTSQTTATPIIAPTLLIRATSKARKAAFLLSSVALLSAAAATSRGQSALDGVDPNANGAIRVVVVQPNGKILIGGEFTTLSPNGGPTVTRNRIARLNPDGTLDTAFNPNASATVLTLAVQPDGKVLAGGQFLNIGGATRDRIARLDAVTGVADSWDPNANSATDGVHSIAVQVDGKILVGGDFLSIGGQTRHNLARIDPITGLADLWSPEPNGLVLTIAVQADGKILVGGSFASIGGQTRNCIGRLDEVTGAADTFNPNANTVVRSIVLQSNGKILVGGNFTTIGGATRNHIARFDATTELIDSWDPNANGEVYAIAVQTDGQILVGGFFGIGFGTPTIGGQTRNRIARLDATTGLADSFDPKANGIVNSIAVQVDGKIVVGGEFTALSPNGGPTVTRNRIARLETDGRLDRTLDLGLVGSQVNTMAVQRDGKVVIAGIFSSVLGVARNNIARLNADGTLDLAFDPGVNASVYSIALQTDGKILVGGIFTTVGGQARNRIARLDPATGAADTWDPNSNGEVDSIVVQPDGKILVGGNLTNIGGATRGYIARLDPTTGLADSWNPISNGVVYTIALQTDGKILVGGTFATIGGQSRHEIARLDAVTGLADSFDANSDSLNVYAIVVQADGKILVCGQFSNIGGQPRNSIARLDPATGSADSFDPNTNINQLGGVYTMAVQSDGKVVVGGTLTLVSGQVRNYIARCDAVTGAADSFDPNANFFVYSVAIQPDGKILVGGGFSGPNSIGGQNRNGFARLSNDTVAVQDLSATPTTVTWTRGGSSPQLTRVTFESSSDSVNYTPLGDGTPAGSTWKLTGLNLPIRQNIYIRARGYYHSSFLGASDGIQETVRNAFISPAPTPTQVVSRKFHGGTPYDITLPLAGNSGVECRSGGGTNDYQVVFTFPSAVTFNNAGVIAGTGTLSSSSGSGTTTATVNLTGVTNAQRLTVRLLAASDGTNTGNLDIPMAVLVGDTNGNGNVSATDVSQVKAGASTGTVNGSNFRADVNASGLINATDVAIVKAQSGTALP